MLIKPQKYTILNPLYTGYRSKFFKNHNQPQDAEKDFPTFINNNIIFSQDKSPDIGRLPFEYKTDFAENALEMLYFIRETCNATFYLPKEEVYIDLICALARVFRKTLIYPDCVKFYSYRKTKKTRDDLINFLKYFIDAGKNIMPIALCKEKKEIIKFIKK